MHRHNNYNNKEEPLMPTEKSSSKTTKSDTAKAVVSQLGVNDEPTPTEPKVVKTKNGRTITFN